MPAGLTSSILDIAVARGAAGLAADIRPAVLLLFLAVAPTAAIAGLLHNVDGFTRLVIACAANVTILALVAMIMLAEGIWSPRDGLLAVAAITAVCLVAQLPPVRRCARAVTASMHRDAERRAAQGPVLAAGKDDAEPAANEETGEIPVVAVNDADALTSEIPVVQAGERDDVHAEEDTPGVS